MKKSVPKLRVAILALACCLCLLLNTNNSDLYGRRYQITRTVNHFFVSITPNYKTLNLTVKHPETLRRQQIVEDEELDVSCAGRYVYMYHLPSKFNDDVIKNCSTLIKWFDMCPSMANSGLGPKVVDYTNRVLTGTGSWYATNQFLLEVIFRERMKHYECLTNDSSLASAIYVPFYAGFDVSRYLWDTTVTVRDRLGEELAKWLSERPEWMRLYGRDHFLVSGRIAWDFRRVSDEDSGWGNKLMRLPELANTTMLSIEATAWENDIAIPYPTYFHPTSESEVTRWQRKVKKTKRRFLFSFVGAPRPTMEESVRGEIIRQCLASQGRCNFLNCSETKDCENPVKVMEVFQDSVFCLQPQGDSATRRSIFDSILAGCIPVFFHPASAYNQYTWYFPEDHTKYSVYIPEEYLRNRTVSIEESLVKVNQKKIREMREEVVRLIPKIIYKKPRPVRPVKDAFEIAVGRIIERVAKVKKEIEEGRDPQAEFSQNRDLSKLR
ncbi:PREDICTED: probable xyloglucan galactosyltransferase GT12 [Tarenaya hassleriana]|uniref:probable xyloglucan galactosyltransferase GT12 n=1 Tax=Tarenaya hassleriana TaxID=28532 RepID=UPI00053C1C4C|nr:PREDICTED: probable xyloglucan galactosyltransferase GT12 [Tarenaya hassleriana]